MARQHGLAAINALVRGLSDPKLYVHVAVAPLDRGFGKPRQAIDATVAQVVGGIDAPNMQLTMPEEIEQWLERRRRELAKLN